MNQHVWLIALFFALIPEAALAQDARRSDPCAAMRDGGKAKDFLNFEQFDKELRVALTKQDPVALAFLVSFPLRVNDSGGSISLNDPAALKTHFQEVFTPAVRQAILREKNDDPVCDVEGLVYGRGVIWVESSDRGYAVSSVNRDAVPPFKANNGESETVRYVCQTHTHRIVIDTVAHGELRYRSWNRPRSVTELPDLQLAKGEGTFEGSDVCAYPIYTFKNGGTEYRVTGGLGCFSDTDGPPKDTTGRIDVTVPGKPATGSWCY
jgi:hypothetical protein